MAGGPMLRCKSSRPFFVPPRSRIVEICASPSSCRNTVTRVSPMSSTEMLLQLPSSSGAHGPYTRRPAPSEIGGDCASSFYISQAHQFGQLGGANRFAHSAQFEFRQYLRQQAWSSQDRLSDRLRQHADGAYLEHHDIVPLAVMHGHLAELRAGDDHIGATFGDALDHLQGTRGIVSAAQTLKKAGRRYCALLP